MRVLTKTKGWIIGTDGVQWMLCRAYKAKGRQYYSPLIFIRTTKAILIRCMRERGMSTTLVVKLTAGLPDAFTPDDGTGTGQSEIVGGSLKSLPDIPMPPTVKRTHPSRNRSSGKGRSCR